MNLFLKKHMPFLCEMYMPRPAGTTRWDSSNLKISRIYVMGN